MNNSVKTANPMPHVHWHVRARYDIPVTVDGRQYTEDGRQYTDPNFAHHYDSGYHDILDKSTIEALTARIQDKIDVS
jgi:diadenosine tetraphosphate (Ap4A) HIT family hydrolase